MTKLFVLFVLCSRALLLYILRYSRGEGCWVGVNIDRDHACCMHEQHATKHEPAPARHAGSRCCAAAAAKQPDR